MAKIKATKRSSGHVRAEIRRRYAIAWVEYIDLSRPPLRPPPITLSSPPLPPSPLWISPRHFEPDAPGSVFDCGKSSFPARAKLHVNDSPPIHPPSASRLCDFRAGHYCPWYWRCRPVMPGPRALIHARYIRIHACGLSMILCRVTSPCTTGISSRFSSKDIEER